jgi:hypothetical protein
LDLVAQPLNEVVNFLQLADIKYIVHITRPTRTTFKVDLDCYYVIKQYFDADDICHLVVAAKMGKEVF